MAESRAVFLASPDEYFVALQFSWPLDRASLCNWEINPTGSSSRALLECFYSTLLTGSRTCQGPSNSAGEWNKSFCVV